MAAFNNRVCGIQKMSLLDFADRTSCILWYLGCNNTCPYCYNPQLVRGTEKTKPAEEVIGFLKKRKHVLDGVVFSGGECTIWGNKLIEDIKFTRELGYSVKVDTNGTNPMVVEKLLQEGLVDFFAIDVKCPSFGWSRFFRREEDYGNFWRSLEMVRDSGVAFETRTTVHPDITNESSLSTILSELAERGFSGKHNIQFFFTGDENLKYLDPNINRNPRYFDLDAVDRHGFEINVRNAKGNI